MRGCGLTTARKEASSRIIRETLRKAYRDSSSAVHGGKLRYAAKDPGFVSSAQDICRDGIVKRLGETERPKWDEMILGARKCYELKLEQ